MYSFKVQGLFGDDPLGSQSMKDTLYKLGEAADAVTALDLKGAIVGNSNHMTQLLSDSSEKFNETLSKVGIAADKVAQFSLNEEVLTTTNKVNLLLDKITVLMGNEPDSTIPSNPINVLFKEKLKNTLQNCLVPAAVVLIVVLAFVKGNINVSTCVASVGASIILLKNSASKKIRNWMLAILDEIQLNLNNLLSKKEVEEKDTFVVQGGVESVFVKLFSNVNALVMGLLSEATIGRLPSRSQIENWLKSINLWSRTMHSVSHLSDYVIYFFQEALNFVRVKMLGYAPIDFITSVYPPLYEWCREIDDIIERVKADKFALTSSNADILTNMYKRGLKLLTPASLEKKHLERLRLCHASYMSALNRVKLPFEAANFSGFKPRMEPVTLLLRGASGVGKSWVVKPFIIDMLKCVLEPEEHINFKRNYMDFVYSRQAEHKYWDGYRGQMCAVWDDFGQVKDVAGCPDNEYMDVIRACNLFPHTLHMAALEDKGATTFSSKFCMFTTNMTNFRNVESIVETEAVTRRFNFIVDVVPRAEFRKETESCNPRDFRFDLENPKLKSREFDENVYEFHIYKDTTTGSVDRSFPIKIVSYEDLVILVADEFRRARNVANKYISDLAKRVLTAPLNSESSSEVKVDVDDDDLEKLEDMFREDEHEKKVLFNPAEMTFECLESIGKLHLSCEGTEENLFERKTTMSKDVINDWKYMFQELNWNYLVALPDCGIEVTINQIGAMLPKMFPTGIRKLNLKEKQLLSKFLPSVTTEVNLLLPARKLLLEGAIESQKENISVWSRVYERAKKLDTTNKSKYKLLWVATAAISFLVTFSSIKHFVAPLIGDAVSSKNSDGTTLNETDFVTESNGKGSSTPKGFRIRSRAQNKIRTFNAQGSDDVNSEAMVASTTKGNFYRILSIKNKVPIGYGVFIKNDIFVFPHHYKLNTIAMWEEGEIEKNECYTLFCPSSGTTIELSVDDMMKSKNVISPQNVELAYVQVPTKVNHKNIINYFIPGHVLVRDLSLFVKRITYDAKNILQTTCSKATLVDRASTLRDADDNTWEITHYLKYNMPSSVGDCGSLLFVHDPNVGPGKLLGFHVGGSGSNIGIAEMISKETLLKIASVIDKSKLSGEQFVAQAAVDIPYKGNFINAELAPYCISGSTKTKLRRSPLFEAWGQAKTKPCHLRPFEKAGTVIDPRVKAMEKYGKKLPVPDMTMSLRVADDICDLLLKHTNEEDTKYKTVYSFYEAVVGVPSSRYLKSLARNTSCGYPYCTDPLKSKGKTYYFGSGPSFNLDNEKCEELEMSIKSSLNFALKGKRISAVFVDCLKDERRPIEKVDEGKTRLFCTSPIDYTIMTRMYFMGFTGWFMEKGLSFGSALGLNYYSQDWDFIARSLNAKGTNIIAGDFSGFDACEVTEVQELLRDVIIDWFEEIGGNDHKIRLQIFYELMHSKHISRNVIYEWTSSLPSGHPMTSVVNTLYGMFLFRMAWRTLATPDGLQNNFDMFVCLFQFGDDNILSVDACVADFFNPEAITNYFLTLGIVYTGTSKVGTQQDFINLEDATFLKRGFRYEPLVKRYVAPLEFGVLKEIPYWYHESACRTAIWEENVQVMLREATLHGKDVYKALVEEVRSPLKSLLKVHIPRDDFLDRLLETCAMDVDYRIM